MTNIPDNATGMTDEELQRQLAAAMATPAPSPTPSSSGGFLGGLFGGGPAPTPTPSALPDASSLWNTPGLSGAKPPVSDYSQWMNITDPDGNVVGKIDPSSGQRVMFKSATGTSRTAAQDEASQAQADYYKALAQRAQAETGAPITTSSGDRYILTRNPDGTISQVANPNYRDPAAQAAALAASSRKPLSEVIAEAEAQAMAPVKALQEKIRLGLALTDKDKMDLQAAQQQALTRIQEAAAMERQQQSQQFEKPYRDAQLAAQQEQSQLGRDTLLANMYEKQAQAGQAFVGELTKAGVTPSAETIQGAWDPWRRMWDAINAHVASGALPASAVPTPGAPAAPGAQPTIAPPAPLAG